MCVFVCLFWFILLILEGEGREKMREREKERDTHRCEREMMEPETGVCALTRNRIHDPSV